MQQLSKSKTFIIIVTYNGMKWLPRCLKSADGYPIIVVDNCSTDGTQQYIKNNHPRIKLLEQNENLGFGKANNIGISFALKENADYVFLLNQDAFLKEKALSTLLKASYINPDYGIISPIHLNVTADGLEKVFIYYINRASNMLFSDLLLRKDLAEIYPISMVNAAAWLIPKKTLETVGGFQPAFFLYGEDDNYCQRVLFHNLKIGICPTAFVVHDSNDGYHIEQPRGSDRYFNKFLNYIKIEYADVNLDNRLKLKKLKLYYLKEAFVSALSLNFREARVNFTKCKLIWNLNFERDVENDRKSGKHYLSSS